MGFALQVSMKNQCLASAVHETEGVRRERPDAGHLSLDAGCIKQVTRNEGQGACFYCHREERSDAAIYSILTIDASRACCYRLAREHARTGRTEDFIISWTSPSCLLSLVNV